MGAPHSEIGNHICHEVSKLANATPEEINDTIIGLGRTGAPFKALTRAEVSQVRIDMLELKGFIMAMKSATVDIEHAQDNWEFIYDTVCE